MASKKKTKKQSENLYEPVNPPPLYGNESYLSKDLQQQVPQGELPAIEIPPELDIITSEGLDGLDKPDLHDKGFDGDREWQHTASEDEGPQNKPALVPKGKSKSRQARSPTPKSVGFAPEPITHEVEATEGDQEVPEQMDEEMETSSVGSERRQRSVSPHGRRRRPFDILKSKAVGCADHVKQKIRDAIPERRKVAPGSLRKKRKKKGKQEEEETGQEVQEEGEKAEEGDAEAPPKEESQQETEKVEEIKVEEELDEEKKRLQEEEKLRLQQEKEEREKKEAEEKLAKQKAAEEAKKAKEEEKARKAEEKRKAKEEEEKRKQKEKEEKERIAAEKKKEEEARKAAEKAKKEEEARIAAEKKKEEEARKAAEKAKKEEEARIAAEAKKAELEAKKAAEKAKKEEEARLAAEKKKEEEARLAEENLKAAESKVEEVSKIEAEEMQVAPDEATEAAAAEPADGQPEEEDMEVAQPQTPSGTTKRKYIRHRRQLPSLPNPITTLRNQVEDFKNRLKRSRTPPRRTVQRKHRRNRSADASRSPPRDIEDEPEEKPEDGEKDEPEVKVEETAQTPASPVEPAAEEEGSTRAVSEEPAQAETSTGTRGRVRKQAPAKEKLDKIGASLKGFGAKSMDIASKATKEVGQTMKVVGKNCQKLGSKAVVEMKAKQEAAKNRKASQVTVEMEEEIEPEPETTEPAPPEPAPPKRTFRFRRRGQSQDEQDEEMERAEQDHFYENAAGQTEENRLLGSGAKDWESPHERGHSRDVSEEPYSGNASARDSPPGSSLASSTFAQVRRTGVLEEIDSDEFFLRERGISEGEDEEEVNRLLVEELRQAFRPTMVSNALEGFDIEPIAPPPRPERTPRKPPRKEKDDAAATTSYQTFPPERPKRKQPQGYVSKFMKEHEGEYEDEEGEIGSNEEVRGSSEEMRDLETDDGMEILKAKLSKIESAEEEEEPKEEEEGASREDEQQLHEQFDDDGRYEPINEGPVKPSRARREKKPKRPPTPPSFYYNTIAANEWRMEMENAEGSKPAAPARKRRDSGKSASVPRSEGGESGRMEQQITIETDQSIILTEPSASSVTIGGPSDDTGDYVDEAGYAIVQKDRETPTTIPRKKKKRVGGDASPSSNQAFDPSRQFFSMPRASHQTPEVPPQRPNRTYSTLRPKRPARSKSGSRQSLDKQSPAPSRKAGESDESRPSTAIGIGIMQGRPLPPPPRPQRSQASLHDLDQRMIEQSLGLRHYANFADIEPQRVEEASPHIVMEVDMACQTDPVPEDEFIVGMLTTESLSEDGSRIITASSRVERLETRPGGQSSSTTTAGDDVSPSFQSQPPQQSQTQSSQNTQTTASSPQPPFVFPTRLHLEELEVDFLRVKELQAQKIRVEHLQASDVEANSINASGSIYATKVHTHLLQSDDVSCSRLTADSVEIPSLPPLSFHQLSSPEQELCLKAEEKGEQENESACPLEITDSMQNLMSNVDSSNDLKSSHVAEKVLDKQLNVVEGSPASSESQTTKKDASVGTPATLSRNVPTQLNNLNQESSRITQPELPQLPSQPATAPVAITEIQARHHIETEEDGSDPPVEEEEVVRGSYTLPYSYMTSHPPTPPRTSSMKRRQHSSESRPKSPGTPKEEARVAFGHTSVAQGDVLSVKLSIPVERLPTPTGSGQTSPRLRQAAPTSTPPDSAASSADSAKKSGLQQRTQEKRKTSTPSEAASLQLPPSPPPPPSLPSTSAGIQGPASLDSEEGFLSSSARLGRAVLRFAMRSLQSMADYIDTAASEDPSKTEQQRANMQVLLCLLLVLVVGLILASTPTGTYTAPRWEFLMPPPDL